MGVCRVESLFLARLVCISIHRRPRDCDSRLRVLRNAKRLELGVQKLGSSAGWQKLRHGAKTWLASFALKTWMDESLGAWRGAGV